MPFGYAELIRVAAWFKGEVRFHRSWRDDHGRSDGRGRPARANASRGGATNLMLAAPGPDTMDSVPRRVRGVRTMVADPDFSHDPMTKAGPGRRWSGTRRTLLVLFILSALHMLGTGSPIPLWHIERLENPVAVTTIDSDALVLADGRRVRLPFITKIPKDDPAFARVLSHGVEVGDQGEVFGLIDPPRMCGNDPVVFYRKRIDLSEFAGLLDPDGIDDTIVLPEEIQEYKENYYSRSRDRRGMPLSIMLRVPILRRIYESARYRLEKERLDSSGHQSQGREVSRELLDGRTSALVESVATLSTILARRPNDPTGL